MFTAAVSSMSSSRFYALQLPNEIKMGSANIYTQQMGASGIYDDGYLQIEYDNFFVSCNGQRIKMPRTEFLILSRLAQCPDRFVTHQDLWKYAWGNTKPLSPESLKVYIYHLRQLFEPFGIRFETMVNVGYRFIPANKDSFTK